MKKKKLPDNQIAFYQAPGGSVNIEVLYAEENIWLPQKRMAELFDTTPQNITQHLKNIYSGGELDESATCKEFLQVQKEGDREIAKFLRFNLKNIENPYHESAGKQKIRQIADSLRAPTWCEIRNYHLHIILPAFREIGKKASRIREMKIIFVFSRR